MTKVLFHSHVAPTVFGVRFLFTPSPIGSQQDKQLNVISPLMIALLLFLYRVSFVGCPLVCCYCYSKFLVFVQLAVSFALSHVPTLFFHFPKLVYSRSLCLRLPHTQTFFFCSTSQLLLLLHPLFNELCFMLILRVFF